jgi:putative PIN family toxin of toxin-antitoxin system
MGTLRVVPDTNVLVSALGFGGPPLQALLRTFDTECCLLASEATLAELRRVMTYDHLPFTDADRAQYLAVLRREAEIVDPAIDVAIARDADDHMFLELAQAGDADYLVSGDGDLLTIGDRRRHEDRYPRYVR